MIDDVFSFRLPIETSRRMRQEAASRGISMSAAVRLAARAILAEPPMEVTTNATKLAVTASKPVRIGVATSMRLNDD